MTDLTELSLPELSRRIEAALAADRSRLRKSLRNIQRLQKSERPFDRSLTRLLSDLERSENRLKQRQDALPAREYDPTLPITARRDEIRTALQQHQVIVVCGETGSGKSTQLPKICLDAGFGLSGIVGHTQPRRIAARAVASRVADELGTRVGDAVSFKIRFTDTTSPKTLVKLMTDGILLAESQSDPLLSQYDVIIIDEAHERSLNIDFLLGCLKRLLARRPELRVIITSATIDAERFAAFFGTEESPAPILEVSGRTYPVEIRNQPPEDEEDADEIDWPRHIADTCERLTSEGPGDILVFLPTERDIREAAKVLAGRAFAGDGGRKPEIVPLFGRLSEREQQRIFDSHTGRRIVIATNVAESSLTVPGIRFVIDSGLARISRFSASSHVQRLPVEAISQASANQRAGRCGRVGPGICVRLFSAEDLAGRDAYTAPEILRTNLASVLLQMKAFKLGAIEDFPFLDSPQPSAIRSGLKMLFELGAIDEQESLTKLGNSMSRLPVDPRIARMILEGHEEQCLEEILIIAAALELRDPRERPLDRQQAADEAHQKFQHETSDFLSLLKLWDFYAGLAEKLSSSKLRKACQQNFISYNRMREWRDLQQQLRDIIRDRGLKPTPRRNQEQSIHRAILSGLLGNVALRGNGHEYTGSGGQKLFLWPGSAGFTSKPKWMMAAELVETTRRFARTIAPIQPQWVETLGSHLVKRTYSEPHWDSKSTAVMAFEKVLLSGLPIVPRRRVRYGPIEPKLCREMFIQHALVEGDFETPGEFRRHNERLKEELAEWQAKLRQGLQLTGDDAEFDFYDQRLPETVCDGPSFETWRKRAEAQHPRLLFLSRDDLIQDADAGPRQNAFPDHLQVGTMRLPVEYHLEPGSEDDGVTLLVPQEGLNQLSEENLAWLVPGLLEEKVAALIKTLPKNLRILFVPVPETAAVVARRLAYGQGDLLSHLAAVLREHSGEYVPVGAFDSSRLPDHLRFNIRVLDAQGKLLVSGREISQLRAKMQQQSQRPAAVLEDQTWHRDGITSWDWDNLPRQVELARQGTTVLAFPTLKDQGQSVSLGLAESPERAEWDTRLALTRLFLLQDGKRIQEQVKHLPGIDNLTVQALALPEGKTFQSDLAWQIARSALFNVEAIPRTRAEWDQRLKQARNQIPVVVQDLTALLPSLMSELSAVRKLLRQPVPPAIAPLINDLKEQFEDLVRPGFFRTTPLIWLKHSPRYLQAMQLRFQKATTGGFQKDRRNQQLVQPFWRKYQGAVQTGDRAREQDPQLIHFRFLLEEFRVSLFAQQLRTAVPVSEKKLNGVWQSRTSGLGNR